LGSLSGCTPRGLPSGFLRPTFPFRSLDPEGPRALRGEARIRFSWTFPNGAPPFGAFPSSAAVPRQPCFSAALHALDPSRADPVWVSCLERCSTLWLGPPRSLPSRRCSRFPHAPLRSSASAGCVRDGIPPFARPQGFRPLTNPLRSPRVSTRRSPVAPLGFAPRRPVLTTNGSSGSHRSRRRSALPVLRF
jgi:hypothetical protein